MEELRSTETLDREILEDARRKAGAALKAADAAAAAAAGRWAKRERDDKDELKRKFADRLAAERAEIMARLPLEQRRLRTARIEGRLAEAIAATLAAQPRAALIGLLAAELRARAAYLPEGPLAVRSAGLARTETAALLAGVFPGRPWSEVEPSARDALAAATARAASADPTDPRAADPPSLTIEAGRVTVRASVAAAAEAALADHRAELASALLGKEAIDD
jgi:hypothetical protein